MMRLRFLKDYFEKYPHYGQIAYEFNSWSEKDQEDYVDILKAFLNDVGKKRIIRKIYNIATEKMDNQEFQENFREFLIYEMECFIKNLQGTFLWVVFNGVTTLIDMNSLLFTKKGVWMPLMHFESILGSGGKRAYYLFDHEEGFVELPEENCFDALFESEKEARKRIEDGDSEEKRLKRLSNEWKKACGDVLKPTRFEKKRVRLSKNPEVFNFRKLRKASIFELDESEYDDLIQTRLVCNTDGQVRFSFALDESDLL